MRLCLLQPNRGTYSESFVQAHAERLPAETMVIYGGWFPYRYLGGEPIMPGPLGLARNRIASLPLQAQPLVRRLSDIAMAGFLRRGRFQAVLAEYGPTGAESLRACRLAAVPLIAHFHGADAFEQATLDTYRAAYQDLFAEAAGLIAVSRAMERQLLALGAPRDRLHYLLYGVDPARFAAGSPASAPPHFLAVGRFVEKKAPHLTLLAFQRVLAACPAARLTMVGDGPLWGACRWQARALGMAEAVAFPGPLPHAEVAALMARSRAFVQHSVVAASGDSEGTPVVIIEAGCAGLPVVATRHAGIPDVVIDGQTGLLVDEGDVAAMAEQLLALANAPALAGALGYQAAAHIRACCALDQQIAKLWAIIEGAAAR